MAISELPRPRMEHRFEDVSLATVTRGIAEDHPEAYTSLGAVIKKSGLREAGLHITSRRARIELTSGGFFVRTIPSGDHTRYFVRSEDAGAINSHLQHLLYREPQKKKEPYSLDKLTRGVAEHHPELFSTIGSVLVDAGFHVGPRKTKSLVNYLKDNGFEIGVVESQQPRKGKKITVRKYYISTKDRFTLSDYFRKHRSKVLSVLGPSTSPHN